MDSLVKHDEGDYARTGADADEAPSPRPDPETSTKSGRGQERKMDDSNKLLEVDEVRLDVDATPPPNKDATQSGQQGLDEEMVGSHQQKPKGELIGSSEQDKGSTADEVQTRKDTTREQKPTRSKMDDCEKPFELDKLTPDVVVLRLDDDATPPGKDAPLDGWIAGVVQQRREKARNLKSTEFDREFYNAVRSGKLAEVKKMLDADETLLYRRFTMVEANAVQLAVVAGQEMIVSELLSHVKDPKLMVQRNDYGETALTLAAAGGKILIVTMLVEEYEDLVDVPNSQGCLPVVVAALYGRRNIVTYLFPWIVFAFLLREEVKEVQEVKKVQKFLMEESKQANNNDPIDYDQLYPDNFKVLGVSINTEHRGYEKNYDLELLSKDLKLVSSSPDDEATFDGHLSKHLGFMLFKACIKAEIYDTASEVFQLCPDECIEGMKKEKGTTLYPLALADLASEKRNRSLVWVYDKIFSAHRIGACDLLRQITKELFRLDPIDKKSKYHAKPTVIGRPMLTAILQGNVDFIEVVTEECPDVLWFEIDGLTLFAHAISKGPEKIYKLAYKRPETGHLASLIPDRDGNTLLHQAAMLSQSPSIQFLGPALQMQIDLQRFKEMEKKAPMCKGILNKNNKTPIDLFREEHKELKNEARRWLKDVATSCSVVATLIVTIMFAAAFTAPGGYKEDTGIPTNLRSKYVTAYIISDAFSLFFSCTSAMIFLGIHTSLFREEDFQIKLPLTLMFGLFTLFLSTATMLVAFGTALVIMLRERFVWISVPLLMIGSIPVIIYAILHVRIFIRVLRVTFPNPTN